MLLPDVLAQFVRLILFTVMVSYDAMDFCCIPVTSTCFAAVFVFVNIFFFSEGASRLGVGMAHRSV